MLRGGPWRGRPPRAAPSCSPTRFSRPPSQNAGSARSSPTIAELLGRLRAAAREQLEVPGHEVGALLLVRAVHREREQADRTNTRIHVARGAHEVRDVRPPGAVAVGDLDRVTEHRCLGRRPLVVELLDRELTLLPADGGWTRSSGSGSSRLCRNTVAIWPSSDSASNAETLLSGSLRSSPSNRPKVTVLAEHRRGLGQGERRRSGGRSPAHGRGRRAARDPSRGRA